MKPEINKNYFLKNFKFNKKSFIFLGLIGYTIAILFFYHYELVRKRRLTPLRGILKSNISLPFNYIKSFNISSKTFLIDISYEDIVKINRKKNEAKSVQELFSNPDDWVPFKGRMGKKIYSGKIRLKGDFNDHWGEDNLWSYKIKLNGDQTFLGMKKFAIQHPRTRGYLNDWYFQKMLGHVGLIESRYFFLPIKINGNSYPIYQVEENKGKRLVEFNNRREGPIFKIFERDLLIKDFVYKLSFFQEKKWKANPNREKLLRRSEKLINDLFYNRKNIEEIFDIDLFAKTIAILDIFGGDLHAVAEGNITFYLNPVTGLIEPIPFDLGRKVFESLNIESLIGERLQTRFTRNLNHNSTHFKEKENFGLMLSYLGQLFNSEKFFRLYVGYLDKYSRKEWLENFFNRISVEEQKVIKTLYKSYPWYNSEKQIKNDLINNQKYITKIINPNYGINAEVVDFSNKKEKVDFKIFNRHSLPLEIIGIKSKDTNKSIMFKRSITLSNNPKTCLIKKCNNKLVKKLLPTTITFNYSDYENFKSIIDSEQPIIISKVIGTNFQFENLLIKKTEKDLSYYGINEIKKIENIEVDDNKKIITINSGNYQILKDIKIPKGYNLKVKAGANIDLKNGSAIFAYSAVNLIGTKERPIIFQSTDFSGQGMQVIKAKNDSYINNVIFKDLTMPNRPGFNNTSVLTFYESNVSINNTKFMNNKSEDSLNIIRSNFNLSNSKFFNSFSDALDLDFSNGIIDNIYMNDIGNDGIDLSGSNVDIKNIFLENLGDKGISVGEKSNANITNVKITNANIGFACKDSSIIKSNKIIIERSQIGFAAYQKKPEFNSCSGKLDSLEFKSNKKNLMVEKESNIKLNNEEIKLFEDNVYEKIY